ncbi:hypothetical protein KM043_017723 [Ampulex compressa]|nr:hypothetical protein KM043_017723 [Ampulex compressa]
MSTTLPSAPTELSQFPKLCELRRKFPVLYRVEFQTATKVETHSCRHATKPANKEKNQNQRCIPYDYNRVVLDTIEGEPDSDYVNASYVDSILKPNAYIVTQGPTENTVTEFWRMVWQERASCVVMLTKTFDFIRVMCVQYWPASKDKDEEYGGIGVSVLKEEELANFHIRTIKLYKKNENDEITEERTLLQFHYTEWHSHTCPFGNAVLEFRRRVRAVVGSTIKNESGPMVVHCNDGGGRSGVYLAIDANMELAEEEDAFDVFGYLKKLRQSRRGLIENLEQYKFIYDTLEEFVVCGTSWFPVSELSQRLKQKSVKNPITKMNEYQREYQQICKQTPRFTIGDCAGGHRADNREKNRDVLVVPPDNFRPYLTSFQGNNFTDYINAVFVDGYTKPREYIVTEWPLRHTCGEFWSLVYDYECAAVVVLCVPPQGSTNFPSFWPEGRHSKKYGPVFTIDHISHNHYTNIKTWVFRINKKIVSLTELMAGVKAPPKTVQLFQLTCWPMGHKVPTSTNSLVELMNMVERWRQRTDYGPVAVVSPDGRSRCGVYCAANACIEQVIQHGEVDIFQAVKTVRRHRPQLIENMTEYKYCYDLVLHYVLHYLNKDMNEKKPLVSSAPNEIPPAVDKNKNAPQSPAARPEELGVTPWYIDDYPPLDTSPGPVGERSSYPSYSHIDRDPIAKPDVGSTRNSSMDSEVPSRIVSTVPRKAYMDLSDAIALLDETCPNQEHSPSLTPRTPRTPQTPYPRNKRARSKSSDNSSNYSNDRLSDRSFETRQQDKDKKRPFLKKIGISKTEDRPFFAKLAPRIIGKPYLEKIGPSRAVERPFLDKIGSSRTLDKFVFDPASNARKEAKDGGDKVKIESTIGVEIEETPGASSMSKEEKREAMRVEQKFVNDRRRSGKGFLLKMYSFETEDLESSVQAREHRDPLRGASLDDMLDSGPSSLPPMENIEDRPIKAELERRPTSVAELLKCRVTTSEEIIFSSTSTGSPKEPNSWINSSPRQESSKADTSTLRASTRRRTRDARESGRSDESASNSPTKRPISSISPDRALPSQIDSTEREVYSPTKTRRQTYEDFLDGNRKSEDVYATSRKGQFEKRGISSDNLLSKDGYSFVVVEQGTFQDVEKVKEAASSEDFSFRKHGVQEYSKETFKQLQDKFKFHEIPTESYAEFRRRTRSNIHGTIGRQKDRLKANTDEQDAREETSEGTDIPTSSTAKLESDTSIANEGLRSQGSTVRSVLRKQDGMDQPSDQESDTNASFRRPKRRIFHEPSQETMDLLTELRKVKSLLKTPSWEKDLDLDKKPARLPKRILLTDKEFCLSIERESSIRRPSRVINSLETTEEGKITLNGTRESRSEEIQKKVQSRIPGPALFEKKCLSLDYADEEKPQKPEARTISLASARNLPSETEESADCSDLVFVCDSKSCSSDVFNTPSEETNEKIHSGTREEKEETGKTSRNHCAEVDITIPIDQKVSSPKARMEIQGRTGDLYEIISPRSTPFRVKKRLGKISVEETVKPESFTVGSKVDCQVVAQKQTKCFPL